MDRFNSDVCQDGGGGQDGDNDGCFTRMQMVEEMKLKSPAIVMLFQGRWQTVPTKFKFNNNDCCVSNLPEVEVIFVVAALNACEGNVCRNCCIVCLCTVLYEEPGE